MDLSYFVGTRNNQRAFLMLFILFVSLLITVVVVATKRVPRPPRTATYYPIADDSASKVEFKFIPSSMS